ncbi:MAG TPA: proprotein convertase P-domain-containing protein [Thermoanaerobaculales bacterium]|nr:proprotein convertase P-domain-containing protein [Thermoanaerobaculales bacterium]
MSVQPTVRSLSKLALAAGILAMLAPVAAARTGVPPMSHTAQLAPLDQVAVLPLESIDREALLAEDEAAKAGSTAKPLRVASPVDLEVTPADAGTWERLPGGGWVWRLRVHAPNATDLNFGFSRYRLAVGATLHVWSEDYDYVEGPYTAADASHAGDLWTPVVPGERAVIELFEPDGADPGSELVLGRVGRGYRDLFRLDGGAPKVEWCNVDVICPEGDPWRDEIRSVARIMIGGTFLCTGTLIMDVPGSFVPYFVTAHHCHIPDYGASSVVAYWNFQSPVCGDLGGGSLADNQTGAILRASRQDNDLCLIELEEDPDPSFDVHFAGWDARTATAPQGSFSAHHPAGDEKMLTLNDDPLTTTNNCAFGGPSGTHWNVTDYESGTTEGGSSGSALWDSGTHMIVGYLTGGGAACSSQINDCYGKFAVGFDGPSADSRMKDWLDPADTGTRFVAGSDPNGMGSIRLAGITATDSCATGQGNHNGVWEPGETIQIAVDLTASGTTTFTGIQGTLTSQTSGVTVTDGSATWPNLPPGGTVTSSAPHFTIRIGSGVSCGSTVYLLLQVTSAQGGPYVFQPSGSVGSSLTPEVPLPIPDDGTVTSDLVVGQNVALSDVNVRVEIDHTYVGDLIVSLRSPAGTTVTLLNSPACGDNDMNVTFDDASSVNLQSYCAGTTPWYQGVARPYQALSAFNGQSSAGTWTLTVTDDAGWDTGTLVDWELLTIPALSGTCQACGGGGTAANTYLVAGIAHAPGLEGSNWRSKLALLNRSGLGAEATLTYVRSSGPPVSRSVTVANSQLMAWDDVAVALFGVSADSSGAVKVDSTQPLLVTARTYNLSASGTYGQFLPGVEETDALSIGGIGLISQLAKNASFRTNIGFVNFGEADCRARVTLRNSSGSAVGSQRTVTVPASGWKQDNDIFQAAGAGTFANAYATVEVLTEGCAVWGYGSVVDNNSGDPTTIPMEVE